MYTTHLRKVGGSVMLVVPSAILDLLHLQPGSTVSVDVESGRLVVEPQARSRYSLDELLAQCDTAAEISTEDKAWFETKPIGNELL